MEEDSYQYAGRHSLVWRKTLMHVNKGKTGEGNYASSQAHRCMQISSAVKNAWEHLDVLLQKHTKTNQLIT